MSSVEIQKQITAIQQTLEGQPTRERLMELRAQVDKLGKQLGQTEIADDPQARFEHELHQKELERVRLALQAEMDRQEAEQQLSSQPGAQPGTIQHALQQQDGAFKKFFDSLGEGGIKFLRGIFSGLHLTFAVNLIDKWALPIDIHKKMKQTLPASRVFSDSRDGSSVEALRNRYKAKLAHDGATEATYTFEMYYVELINRLAKNETERRSKMSGTELAAYQPRYTIQSLLAVSTVDGTAPKQGVAPKEAAQLNLVRERPAIELAHVETIRRAFNDAGAGIGELSDADNKAAPAAGPQGETPKARVERLTLRKTKIADKIIAKLKEKDNSSYLYLKDNGTLHEREPYLDGEWHHFLTRLPMAFASDDVVLTNFENRLKENPIDLYKTIVAMNADRIDGIGANGKRSLKTVIEQLNSNKKAARHEEGLKATNREALEKQQADKKETAQEQATPKEAPKAAPKEA